MSQFSYFKKLYIAAFLVLLVIFAGVIGFMVIADYRLLDAFYMTIITVGSVGYGEVRPLDDHGKLFTSFLIIFSLGTFAYALSVVTTYIIEGEFNRYFKHIKTTRVIKNLRDHVIVCGYGRNGKQACEQIRSGQMPFVVIEPNQKIIDELREEGKVLFIQGDATHDEVLVDAGIGHAKALITTLPSDADNVFVVLTAREINPKIKIISRASDDASENKLKRAGADNVIMPDKIGGTHMAALVTKPDVLEFIDHITGRINIKLEEISYSRLPDRLKNKSIRELDIRSKTGANIIGFKTGSGEYIINPGPETIMLPDAKLFVLGTQDQVNKVYEILLH